MTYEKDDAVFRFGNQGVLKSGKRWRLPVSLYGVSGSLLVNEVEGGCPLLISEVSMTALDVSIHFGTKTIDVGAISLKDQNLETHGSGHLVVSLLPEATWKRSTEIENTRLRRQQRSSMRRRSR